MSLTAYRRQWSDNITRDILAGMVGTFALIPEVIAFSFVAGIEPQVGLFASFVISVVIAFTGGRPGMISGAAGSVALVVASLVKAHGVQYLLAATLMAGCLQVVFGLLKLNLLMCYVSRPVRTGFVNALGILIFCAQLPHMMHVSWHTYAMIALGVALIYFVPRETFVVPSPLVCVVVLTVVSLVVPMPLETVADLGTLPHGLPGLTWPHVPLSFETLEIITPYAFAIAAVGLLESMLTASVTDDLTETTSNKRHECTGLGLANIAAGLFGGIAGCGMIGQTVGNIQYGGRGRLSTFTAGAFLLLLTIVLHQWLARVPVAALVAIMITVSVSTFSWSSLAECVHHPRTSSITMLVTAAIVIATKDLAAGVIAGVVLNGLFFSYQVMQMVEITKEIDQSGTVRTYHVSGQIFFASTDRLIEAFDTHEAVRTVRIDLHKAHLWDITAVGAIEDITHRFRRHDIEVELIGMNEASAHLMRRHSSGVVPPS